MITDKLGKPAQVNNIIAIAELKLNDQLVKSAQLVFATVIQVFGDHLVIKYHNYQMIDNNFFSEEFIILSTPEEKITYIGSCLEMPLGYSNVR